MSVYEVIVGNIGSVYQGRSRTTALATYESYVEISKEHVGARCYGEDVTLLSMARSSRSTRVICAASNPRGAGCNQPHLLTPARTSIAPCDHYQPRRARIWHSLSEMARSMPASSGNLPGSKRMGQRPHEAGGEGSFRHRCQPGCRPGKRTRWLASHLPERWHDRRHRQRLRRISMTKPQSSSTASTATSRRERFTVPDTSRRGTAITPNTVPGRSTDTADVRCCRRVGCPTDPSLPRADSHKVQMLDGGSIHAS